MNANEILKKILENNRGPYERFDKEINASVRHGDELREHCIRVFEEVSNEIIYSIVGMHPEGFDGLSVEYDHDCEIGPPRIELRFWDKATMNATEIATKFLSVADIPIEIIVSEKTSEFKST